MTTEPVIFRNMTVLGSLFSALLPVRLLVWGFCIYMGAHGSFLQDIGRSALHSQSASLLVTTWAAGGYDSLFRTPSHIARIVSHLARYAVVISTLNHRLEKLGSPMLWDAYLVSATQAETQVTLAYNQNDNIESAQVAKPRAMKIIWVFLLPILRNSSKVKMGKGTDRGWSRTSYSLPAGVRV